MRYITVTLVVLALVMTASLGEAKEKKHDKQMDPQAMMELWQKLAQPGDCLLYTSRCV